MHQLSHECFGGNITVRDIFLALDSPSLMWIVGFDATCSLIPDVPLCRPYLPSFHCVREPPPVMCLQVNFCCLSFASEFLPLLQKDCKQIICVQNVIMGECGASCTE